MPTTRSSETKVAVKINREDFRSVIGEGFHTAFRKGTDAPQSSKIWNLIKEMDDEEWSAVVAFVADPIADFLEAGHLQLET